MPRSRFLLLQLLLLLGISLPGLAAAAVAAPPSEEPAPLIDPFDAEPTAVRISALPSKTTAKPGDLVAIAVILNFEEGWHVWPEKGVTLPASVDEFAYRTDMGIAELPKWVGSLGRIQWPKATPASVPDPSGGGMIDAPTYQHRAIAYIPVTIAPDAPAGPQTLKVTATYQACNESTCLQQEDPVVTVAITIAADTTVETAEPSLFAGFDAAAGSVAASPPAPPGASQSTAAITPNTAPSLFGIKLPRPDSPLAVVVLLLVSALGGAVLNLTPCVLPVIPIKIMTLVQHAGSRDRALVLGMWMALGVIAFWTVAGLPMAIFSSALDPSRIIFGTWWVTLILGLLIGAMGLGIMGLFMINLPQSVYMINPKADSPWGSFVFGVMTAVLGLPCFGFVAGGLLAGAATLPPLVIMVIFAGLGIGMALPYLILSANPGLVEKIPRTGPASELVKQVMGLLLLAAAAFFVSAGIKSLLAQKPYLSESMAWWAVAFFVVIAGVWLTLRTLQISKKAWPRLIMPCVAGLAIAASLIFANGLAVTAREDYARRQAAVGADDSIVTGAWMPYTPARFEKAVASGKVIVADFTADWCINCKFLKRTYLDRDPLRSRFQKDEVILLEVDLTAKTAPGWKFLGSLGRSNVPTLAIFGPALNDPILHNAYTSDTVQAALDQARGSRTASAPATPLLGRSN